MKVIALIDHHVNRRDKVALVGGTLGVSGFAAQGTISFPLTKKSFYARLPLENFFPNEEGQMDQTGAVEALRASSEAQRALDVVIAQHIRACRDAGVSWNEIQHITGISKPTLIKRWRDEDMTTSTLNTVSNEWDIEIGEELLRRRIHDRFGGNRMSGIASSRSSDNVLLFTGPRGEEFGYLDREDPDGTFAYFGEGQRSNQTMTRGNAAILQHAENGKHLRLFRDLGDRRVRYLGEYAYDTHRIVTGYDVTGQQRELIEFTLRPASRINASR